MHWRLRCKLVPVFAGPCGHNYQNLKYTDLWPISPTTSDLFNIYACICIQRYIEQYVFLHVSVYKHKILL